MKPQKPGTTAKPATQKVKIAIVEDQPEVRRLALRILKGNGYKLLEASNGPEALAVSRKK